MEIEKTGIKRILLINLAFIGDVLLSTPVARALRQSFPDAVIDMMVIPLAAPIARGNPYINEVLEYDKRGKHKKLRNLLNLITVLRQRRYDMAVTTNFAPRGAMLAWAAGIRYRVGYKAQHGELFLTHYSSAYRPEIRHESENYLDVLRPLNITTDDTRLALAVKDSDVAGMLEKVKINNGRKLIVICPAGSYAQKSWTTEGYVALIRHASQVADCYLVGSKAEEPILTAINGQAGNVARILPGTLNLGELAALMAKADVLVSVDTGPMHIANAVGTPVIALFGPTDPRVWGPRGASDIVLHHRRECTPCWGRKECQDIHCLAQIDPAEVITLLDKLLREDLKHVAHGNNTGEK